MHNLESTRMENEHNGKWQKMQMLENRRKCITGKCQNGKFTTWKMAEKSHPGNKYNVHPRKC